MPKTTEELRRLDRQFVWHPFTHMRQWIEGDPLVISAAEGMYLIDSDGNRYLDGVSSLWCNVHGHRVPEIDNAIRAQLDRVAHSTMLGLANEPAILLAERLVKIAPPGLAKVFYSDSGATATEVAFKLAAQYWFNLGKSPKNASSSGFPRPIMAIRSARCRSAARRRFIGLIFRCYSKFISRRRLSRICTTLKVDPPSHRRRRTRMFAPMRSPGSIKSSRNIHRGWRRFASSRSFKGRRE